MVCSGLRPHLHGVGASGEREKVRPAKLPSSQWRNGGNRDSDGARHEGEACINPGLPTPTPKPLSHVPNPIHPHPDPTGVRAPHTSPEI